MRLEKRKEISKRLEKFRIIIDATINDIEAISKFVSIVCWVNCLWRLTWGITYQLPC
jgi:hypothetical protein